MPSPSIHYARTEDGVSIAYWAIGSGSPVFVDVGYWSHIQREWDIPERRAWLERQAEHHRVIRFDHRGSGLSDRNVDDLSLEALGRDIDAVLEHAGLKDAALFATSGGQRAAVAYAANNPERVSQLVLWQPAYAPAGNLPPSLKALAMLRDADWEFYTDTMVLWIQGWTSAETSVRLGAMFREACTAEVVRASNEQQNVDLAPLLEVISVPALLIFRPSVREYNAEASRDLASRIPSARSVFIDGTNYAWYLPDAEKLVATVDAFLAEHEPEPEPEHVEVVSTQELTADTHVVLFTDIAGSSALASRYGDDHAHEVRRAHDRIVREALQAFRGREVKHTGDGIMAAFAMASHGLNCAIEIQRNVAAYNDEHETYPLSIYVGLNAGEPIAENEDLFGTSVDLAARICDFADSGQILVSDVVRQLVAGKQYLFSDHGLSELRGMEDPIRLWEVRWLEVDG